MITRFAPSPTGLLHLGHAFSALTVSGAAQAAGGTMLLRIEDIDRTRCKFEYEAAIYEDLAWLGLNWQQPARRQSDHMDDYQRALDRLRDKGLLYRCFRTRREMAEAAASAPHEAEAAFHGGPAPDQAERLARGEPFAWRLSQDRAREALGAAYDRLTYHADGADHLARPETAGDIVLARKDVGIAYHLASVVDDALQGVTHIVRGQDLREAVHVQRLLQALLDLPVPAYMHHKLILGPDGKKFSKRDGAVSLQALRAGGATPADIRQMAGLI